MSAQSPQNAAQSERAKMPSARYAVIDLAVAETLRAALTDKRRDGIEPLFSRNFARKLLEVGPWLVRLSQAPDIETMLAEIGDELPWGYYVQSPVDILTLRKSLRRYNQAQIPNPPREVLFRYWDPRVMGVFLNITTDFQRERLFDWIDAFEVAGVSHYPNAPRA
ncbi:MAG: hypothetical protein ACJA2X_000891 [Halocynthiibacter sp.]|jgi:hypothetical protein